MQVELNMKCTKKHLLSINVVKKDYRFLGFFKCNVTRQWTVFFALYHLVARRLCNIFIPL